MEVPVAVLDVFIVSGVRFLRDSLAEIFARVPALNIRGEAAGLAEALAALPAARPDILLLDAGIPGGPATARRLREAAPGSRIIVIGVGETAENILAWAEAGIAGYVPNTASIDELILLIGQISQGEQPCPSGIAGSLLRRIAAGPAAAGQAAAGQAAAAEAPAPLTGREQEIYRLVGAGLSNKDIARRLRISLGTTKSHVHNLLGKLSLQRRADVMARAHGAER
jgi:DNA-binding NarL/FixJ family response regulator